MDYM
jgi:dynein regulatory complex protein 1